MTDNNDQTRDDYLILKDATRFLGEIQIILSSLLIIASMAVISVYSSRLYNCAECEHPFKHEHMIGLVTYSSVVFLINVFDIGTAFFLISGSNNLNVSRCQYWILSTETTLLLFSIVTLIFIFLLDDWLVFLGLLPSLLLKPLGLWIVKGFIFKLQQIYTRQNMFCETDYSSGSLSVSPISHNSSGSTSMNTKSLKKSQSKTTVFVLNRNDSPGTVHSYQKLPN